MLAFFKFRNFNHPVPLLENIPEIPATPRKDEQMSENEIEIKEEASSGSTDDALHSQAVVTEAKIGKHRRKKTVRGNSPSGVMYSFIKRNNRK